MTSILRRLPPIAIILWLTQIICLIILWNYLPNQITSVLFALLIAVNGVLLYLHQFELPTLTSVALFLSVTHYGLSNSSISPLLASAIVFVGVTLAGLAGQSLRRQIDKDDWLTWFLIGLFTAQIAIFTQYWPISFFQKSALGTTIFYFIWQLWTVIDPPTEGGRQPLFGHFVFVALAVMVVITTIAWTTWPGLNSF
ncbi:MAG: hypothetical protein AAB774_00035 [Patescibacteria group bacterium]